MQSELDIDFCNGFFYTLAGGKSPNSVCRINGCFSGTCSETKSLLHNAPVDFSTASGENLGADGANSRQDQGVSAVPTRAPVSPWRQPHGSTRAAIQVSQRGYEYRSGAGPCTFSERIIVGPEIRWSLSLPALEEGDDRGPEGLWHHLQLLALLWLWVLLLGVGLWGRNGTSPTPRPPVKSFKNRSQELPRLAGLLPKPLWAAWEQAAPSRPPAPWAPPPRLSGPRGRRTGDPPQQGWPEEAGS
jgi:hypothetical protein